MRRHRREAGMAIEPATHAAVGPERPGGQGLDHNQEESGNLAIWKLARERRRPRLDRLRRHLPGRPGRRWAYEAWALRGMVRWVRRYAMRGGYSYDIIEVLGENPLGRQDPRALATFDRASWRPEQRSRAVHRTRGAHLPLRLRAHLAALRQPQRAGPRRQPEELRVRPAAGPARRARCHPVALAARV